jgi:endonuclease/exonuclease/phosphatase family metal-dependent hydrolase
MKNLPAGLLLLGSLLSPGFLEAASIRVVTINVWAGLDYKGSLEMGEYEDPGQRARRASVLVAELKELDPEVVAVNEANKLPGYARSLAHQLGYDFTYHVGLGGLRIGPVGLPVNLREGDALLAKKSLGLRRAGRKQLSGGPVGNIFTAHFADATQVIAARIHLAGLEVYVFNTHWHASPFPTPEYLRQLRQRHDSGLVDRQRYEQLVAEAGEGPGYTWDGERNSNIRLQKETFPEDFWLEPTRKRIDFIFLRGDALRVIRCRVVFDRPVLGTYPSDHFGVMADIEILGE